MPRTIHLPFLPCRLQSHATVRQAPRPEPDSYSGGKPGGHRLIGTIVPPPATPHMPVMMQIKSFHFRDVDPDDREVLPPRFTLLGFGGGMMEVIGKIRHPLLTLLRHPSCLTPDALTFSRLPNFTSKWLGLQGLARRSRRSRRSSSPSPPYCVILSLRSSSARPARSADVRIFAEPISAPSELDSVITALRVARVLCFVRDLARVLCFVRDLPPTRGRNKSRAAPS